MPDAAKQYPKIQEMVAYKWQEGKIPTIPISTGFFRLNEEIEIKLGIYDTLAAGTAVKALESHPEVTTGARSYDRKRRVDKKPVKLRIVCPECGSALSGAKTNMIGDIGTCRKCNAEFVIKTKLKIDVLRMQIRDPVKEFAERLLSTLSDNLQSITVVGSSLTDDFRPGQSDINTVLLLDRQNLQSINAIASLAKPMSRKKISPPLLMTQSYIERSRDVFGVEFLDFQLAHETIMGDDPFAPLAFDKKDVRLQCERELKAMLIRLRQGYIAASANKKLVRDILISTARGMAPLLRAMLWLKDIDRNAEAEPTFYKATNEFLIDTNPLTSVIKWQDEKARLSKTKMENAYESVYSVIDQLSDIVDKLKV